MLTTLQSRLLKTIVALAIGAQPTLYGSDRSLANFAGHAFDAETGLVYAKARYYHPALGSFTSSDPLFVQKPHRCLEFIKECQLYNYSNNNPTNLIDPKGLQPHRPIFLVKPKWGKTRGRLGGTKMTVILGIGAAPREPGSAGGSKTNSKSLAAARQSFKNKGGDPSDFKAGHLLNEELGGQAKGPNLTPLTAATNMWHKKHEAIVKKALNKLSMDHEFYGGSADMGVKYEVEVHEPRDSTFQTFGELSVKAEIGEMVGGVWQKHSDLIL